MSQIINLPDVSDIYMIDMHVHSYLSQEKHANLTTEQTLDYWQRIGSKNNKKVVVRINDHDNVYGGIKAFLTWRKNPEKYPNIIIIPGVEFNASLNSVVMYEDSRYPVNPAFPNSTEKYKSVFKKAHVCASPRLDSLESITKWIENKDLKTYSKLTKMRLTDSVNEGKYDFKSQAMLLSDAEKNRYTNTGEQIIAAKTLITKMLGITIPYAMLAPCTEDGLTHREIVERFYKIAIKFVKANYEPYKNLSDSEVEEKLDRVFTTNIAGKNTKVIDKYSTRRIDVAGLQKIDFVELCQIVEQAGGVIDFAHPNTGFECHKNAIVPVEYLENINTGYLPRADYDAFNQAIKMAKMGDGLVDISNLLAMDKQGLIKVQIIRNAMKQKGLFVDKYVGCELAKEAIYSPYYEIMLDIMDKSHLLPSFGIDEHMNKLYVETLDAKDKINNYENMTNDEAESKLHLTMRSEHNNGNLKSSDGMFVYDDVKKCYTQIGERKKHKIVTHSDNSRYDVYQEEDRVVQLALLDYIVGKPVNFQNSSLFTMRGGRVLDEEQRIA